MATRGHVSPIGMHVRVLEEGICACACTCVRVRVCGMGVEGLRVPCMSGLSHSSVSV